MQYHLAQVNIARLRAPLEDPLMAGFVENLERINALGMASPGFVWIMADGDEHGGNTDVRFFDDPELIANITVWVDLDSLMDFVLQTEHVEFLRRRRQWFLPMREAHLAMWWVPAGHRPDVAEAEERLRHLRSHGPGRHAFTPRHPEQAPVSAPGGGGGRTTAHRDGGAGQPAR